MRFWTVFSRWVGPGGPPLGGDLPPIGPPPIPPAAVPDNFLLGDKSLTYRDTGQTHRMVVTCSMPLGATQVPADLWVWEEGTIAWHRASQTPLVIYPNTMLFSEIAVPLSTAMRLQGDTSQPGGELQCVLVAQNPGGLPNGEYRFAMAPNLSAGGGGGGGGGPATNVNIVAPLPLPVLLSVTPTTWNPPTISSLAASGVVKPTPGFLYQAFGFNRAIPKRYLMFFDSSVVPGNGAPAWLCMNVPGGGTFSVDYPRPKSFTNGLAWAVSTTPGTLTLDASAEFWVQTEIV